MKICSTCKESKPLTEYSFKNKLKGLLTARCKDCHNGRMKAHYKSNKAAYIDRNRQHAKVVLQWLYALKAKTPCADCRTQYPSYIMQFDHVSGTKKFHVTAGSRNSWGQIKKEVAKCEIVCANCHCERTYQRRLVAKRIKHDSTKVACVGSSPTETPNTL